MLEFRTMDVFTQVPFAGNPLAIVLGADDLTTVQMQTIAREFNLSETIFVQRPADASHTAKVRIFFPTAEISFAGHPTIGCAIFLAEKAMPQGDFETRVVLEEEAGIVPVRVWRSQGIVQAELTAPVVPHAATAGPDTDFKAATSVDLLAAATGLSGHQIGFGTHRAGIWQGGPTFLYVPVADHGSLAKACPSEPYWSKLMKLAGVDSAYLYAAGSDAVDYRARMFSPTAGIPEDPATGSASAILAAQLLAAGALSAPETRLSLVQGVEMGRPSQIALTIVSGPAGLAEVRIAGSALNISEGRVRVPSGLAQGLRA